MIKNDHTPLDLAAYATFHSIVYSFIFSVSMFNKNLEPSKLKFNQKLGFIGRNVLTLSVLTGSYKYLVKTFNSNDGRRRIKNTLNIENDSMVKAISYCIPTFTSTLLSYGIYVIKNKNIYVEKHYFLALAGLLTLGELLNI